MCFQLVRVRCTGDVAQAARSFFARRFARICADMVENERAVAFPTFSHVLTTCVSTRFAEPGGNRRVCSISAVRNSPILNRFGTGVHSITAGKQSRKNSKTGVTRYSRQRENRCLSTPAYKSISSLDIPTN